MGGRRQTASSPLTTTTTPTPTVTVDPALAIALSAEVISLARNHGRIGLGTNSLALRADLTRRKMSSLTRGASAVSSQATATLAQLGPVDERDTISEMTLGERTRRQARLKAAQRRAHAELQDLSVAVDRVLKDEPLDRSHHSVQWHRPSSAGRPNTATP